MTILPNKADRNPKRLLCLHPNFPAQFHNIAESAAQNGNEVRFMCQTHYGRSIPGVQRLTLKGRCSHQHLNALGGNLLERSANLAEQYREGLLRLKSSGWNPDVIISHSGWGCGLHAKEVWPHCRHIAYLEWWFDSESDFLSYDPENKYLGINKNRASKLWLRNQALALELVNADEIVSPTQWQARQLPPLLRARCQIIHDGIDLKRFKPTKELNTSSEKVITYGTRGMEPMRGFPQFINSILSLLRENKSLRVEIAGEDEICYGSARPENHETWGKWAKERLSRTGLEHQVRWVGRLGADRYTNWLQASDCHIYLTHPFIASWSLLEALSCNCPMVVSDVVPVRELCEGTRSDVTFVDHRIQASIPMAIKATLQKGKSPMEPIKAQMLKHYSKKVCLEQWEHVAGLKLTTNH